jgi:hypothetical protein
MGYLIRPVVFNPTEQLNPSHFVARRDDPELGFQRHASQNGSIALDYKRLAVVRMDSLEKFITGTVQGNCI